ncbi:hypothetical protein ACTFIZ_009463 [Dictyostelium cf. discoideum]
MLQEWKRMNYTDLVLNNISDKSYYQPTPYPGFEDLPDFIIRLICDFPPSIKSGASYFTDTINRLDFNSLFPPCVPIPSTQQINEVPLEGGEITFIGNLPTRKLN